MKKQYVLLFPLVFTVVGCASPVPVAENFPLSYQKVATTAHHWDVVAEDVITQTTAAIGANPVLQNRGVFVPGAEKSTAFNVAFRDFLINHLVNKGLSVSVCKSTQSSGSGFAMEGSDIEVQYEARIIGHGANMPQYRPGLFTALAGGVAVIHNVSQHLSYSNQVASGIGLGVLADIGAGHFATATRTELIVTTTITENNRYIMHKSDIYYVPDADVKLFSQRVSKQSPSPQENARVAKADSTIDDVDVETSRRAYLDRQMVRWNPNWKVQSDAYSY